MPIVVKMDEDTTHTSYVIVVVVIIIIVIIIIIFSITADFISLQFDCTFASLHLTPASYRRLCRPAPHELNTVSMM